MKPQTMIIGLLALIFGGSAAFGVRQYIGRASAAPAPDTVKVVVAAIDIPTNATVTPDLLRLRDFPKDLVPENALLKIEDAEDRSALMSIVKDEPMLDTKLGPKGHYGMAPKIPRGMRAFTIRTPNVASGVAGFILPGNKVDVLLTLGSMTGVPRDQDFTGGGATTTLLQNLEILAVDQRIEAPAENKIDTKELRSVTLLVTPDQAAKLDLGQNKGTLHLSLRNPEDSDAANTRPATLADLRFYQEPPGPGWDERATNLLTALGTAFVQSRSRPTPAPAPEPEVAEEVEAEPPPPAAAPKRMIRTLRGGNVEGRVFIELPVVQ